MISVNIQAEDIELAKKKAQEMGVIRNSIRKGNGNLVGFLGEILFAKHFGGTIDNTYDYDVIVNGLKVDVKTKETTVKPRDHYYATVAAYNTKQKCDAYYFVRILRNLTEGWLVGGMLKEDFFKKATFNKRGDEDPTSDLGWTFKADCYNMEIKDLTENIEEWKSTSEQNKEKE
jgi:hypothetical protein